MQADHNSSFNTEFDPRTGGYDPRRGILHLTVGIPSSYRKVPAEDTRPPSRWTTPEFVLYYVMAAVVIPVMVWIPTTLSSPSHPNYPLFQRRLSAGWLFGRRVDNSDAQFRSFRSNIPYLLLVVGAFVALKAVYTRSLRFSSTNSTHYIPFYLVFSALFLLGLHGASALKILVILFVNYVIGKNSKGAKWGPVLTWLFNGGVLFANEWNGGYRFGAIHPSLEVLDTFYGIYPRWHLSFNITMLRLVSFNMDHHWAHRRFGPRDVSAVLDEKERSRTPHSLETYSFDNYIAYVLYPPLYIAGPIMTFNDFMWQIRRPVLLPWRAVVSYAARFLACLLTMETILHFMYVVAIKDSKAWTGPSPYTPAQLALVGLWNLIVVWLKLLLPWRFFRLWALVDGIDPPENMVRCVANNYSPLGFWRSWHRSYNLWIVRYIYVPLGGANNAVLTTVIVFTFVALWHDLSFKLLAWGWLVSLFIIPELFLGRYLGEKQFGTAYWYRHLCAVGAVGNILTMMAANLVGFVIGLEGTSYIFKELFASVAGVQFLIAACICLFVAAQLMFEYREEEMRRGIYRRC
ncbi:MBOAT-domain-containing protein [Punctularia strigosozonata HHB-11173 SS5]|uniref:MBOAT-domain-containing protein n=1 Tax=Punctularia strigosozonata (strain HHB-11173) TaxID=741275 RepID=R7S183_PUNST|nr:MBOAT-domain-containing protein [Punctularia strigosozonata HHB-11173 SS5]EIN03983.1 MBOAT-domain-containing protein [Punctularia strigosozonata HHB-11173 SS5]